ncbi:MAG TPA: hypothetical protein VFX92_08295 [Candidatus Krumholzibacteria bacterium]|nr:hypothetical protein [Candidatus Krumholzibacteria bacterium]
MKKYLLPLVAAVMAVSCGTPTSFVSTWRAPDAKPLQFTKVLVVAFVPEESMRRSAEDRMVENITRVEAIPSYRILSKEDMKDSEKSKATVEKLGVDGVVTMRFLGSQEKLEYVPGTTTYGPTYYQPFWGYYGYATPMMYDPGYYTTTNLVRMETNIYSLAQEELLWSGHSETSDPTSLDDLIDSVAHATAKELVAEGLMK